MPDRIRLLGVLGVAALGLALELAYPVNHDVAWLLWLAGQVLDSRQLYRDLIEVNPPLIVWLNLPIVALARATHLDPVLVFRLALVLLLGLSGWATVRLLGRPTMALPVAGVLTLLPMADTGQRDHLALALLLPFLAIAIRRVEGPPVPWIAVLTAGLAAAVAFALKPFLLPIGLLVLLYRKPAPVDAVVVAAGAVYLLAVWILTPDYVPLARLLAGRYVDFDRHPLMALLAMPPTLALVIASLAWLPVRRRGPGDVFLVAAGGAVIGALLQRKGWSYHWYPGVALVALAMPFVISRRWPALLATAAVAWSVGARLVEGTAMRRERAERVAVVNQLVGTHQRVLILSSNFLDVWPAVGNRWVGSLPCLWWTSSPLRGHPAESWLLDRARRDLAVAPRLILVETPARHYAITHNTNHPLALLGPLPGYRVVDSLGGLTAWEAQ
jgi:hypothetical protein